MRRSDFLVGVAGTPLAVTAPAAARPLRLDAAAFGHEIDPYRDPETGIDELAWLYADGLFGWRGSLVPALAARLPQISNGGTRVSYTLRAATWHDGKPLTARDVAAALERVRATTWGSREPYRSVRRLVTRGDLNFDVELVSPRRGFVRSFFSASGVPALPILRSGADGIPLGTGPFAVRARPDPGRWRLERWDRSPRGAPFLDAIDLRLIASETTASVQLLSGEADIALPLTPGAFGSDRFRRVRRFTSIAVLLLNAQGALRDAAARRALAGSIDVLSLQRAYDRRRRALFAALVPGANDERFAALLRLRARDGELRAALGGRELTIAYVRESPAHERVATQLQQMIDAAGVTSVLRPASVRLYAGAAGPLRTGRFDVAIAGFTYGAEPDLEPDWSCRLQPPAGGNFAHWCDPTFDAAVARGDTAAALRRVYDTVGCIPLSPAYEEIGVSRNVAGFVAQPPGIPATLSCDRWRFV